MDTVTRSAPWLALEAHRREWAALHMRDLFEEDPARFSKFSISFKDILFDFSKNLITGETLRLLLDLAQAAELPAWIQKMFRGETINFTEQRAVLHVALRNRANRPILVHGRDVMPEVNTVLHRMGEFAEAVREGRWLGHTGKPITDVVNIGIGGSDLGPAMAVAALRPFCKPGLNFHFVSNVDGAHLYETLRPLSPETTLFIVASKTFTTQETLTNAQSARSWFLEGGRDTAAIARHFVAVSTNADAVSAFGIDTDNMFEFWEWVGGRYSLWSAIGLPIMVAIGRDNFLDFLAGGHEMDEHFRTTPLERNIPVLFGLISLWYNDFFGWSTHAVLPYNQYLHRLPAYLQQLDMESNGKRTTRDGTTPDYNTGPVLWGEAGTNGQHAFYQLIHQGTRIVPADFLAAAECEHPLKHHQAILLANFFAQPKALMKGKTADEAMSEMRECGMDEKEAQRLAPHRAFSGNRPSNAILFRRLDPKTLGSLIAFYEHRVFVQGIIWRINSFDQWGVELGKQLAKDILPALTGDEPIAGHDASTQGLISHYRTLLS